MPTSTRESGMHEVGTASRAFVRPRWSSRLRTGLRLFLGSRSAKSGVPIVLLVVVVAVFAPVIGPQDPFEHNLYQRVQPPFWQTGGNISYPLGTDQFGRDLLSRIFMGGRASLAVGVSAVLLSGLIGVPLGLVSGYAGSRVDEVIMALVDVQMAFPFLLLALVVIFLLGPSLQNLVIALGFAGWVTYARVVRGEVLSVKEREFVVAARAIGSRHSRIVFRHILPQVVTPLIIVATLQIAWMIVIEAALSFLGLGVQPPTPTWGNMLADGREYMLDAWWFPTFPGLAIVITVLGINTLGDWLRDIFDPRSALRNL